MTRRSFPDIEQRSPEWHALRLGNITASTIGQLIINEQPEAADFPCRVCDAQSGSPCVSQARRTPTPMKTFHPDRRASAALAPSTLTVAANDYSRALTAQLVAERLTGYSDPTFVTNDMWRGIEEEPRAVETYEQHTGSTVERMGFMTLDIGAGVLGYSPDGLVGDDGLIEVKAPRAKTHLATILADRVPEWHMAQIQAGMLVADREWCDYVSFCGGLPVFIKRVHADGKWHDAITDAVLAFEDTAARIVADFQTLTAGLPVPERINYNDLGLVF